MTSFPNLTTQSEVNFNPGFLLRNTHFQTIFSSFGPRAIMLKRRYQQFSASEQRLELDCSDGVTLIGFYNQARENPSHKMAILLHGWEGCHGSSYMLSITSSLLASGIDVCRLNMRDHGDTHHLNKGIFNSTLLDEVMSGIAEIQVLYPHTNNYLIGFSLGGNFSLRVAANAHDKPIALDKVIAFCPAIHAGRSNDALLEKRNRLYELYFVRRWKRSLFKKLEHFPDYDYGEVIKDMNSLDDMNHALVPKYTGYDVDAYFESYALTGDRLSDTICPCYLHFSRDDMVIPVDDVADLSKTANLHITITKHGGHCGFLMNWKLDSWQDIRALALINSTD